VSGGVHTLWEYCLLKWQAAWCVSRETWDLRLIAFDDLRAGARMPALVASTAPCCRRHSRESLQLMCVCVRQVHLC